MQVGKIEQLTQEESKVLDAVRMATQSSARTRESSVREAHQGALQQVYYELDNLAQDTKDPAMAEAIRNIRDQVYGLLR